MGAGDDRRTAELAAQLDGAVTEVNGVLHDLRETARGLHPAILAEGGLSPALTALAGRSAVPVRLDVQVPGRLPDPAEMAAGRAREMAALLRAIVESPLPVIVAVDGHVRAGGMGLVGACDIAVAGPRSTFALTEARIGVAPAIISLTLLPKMSARATNLRRISRPSAVFRFKVRLFTPRLLVSK